MAACLSLLMSLPMSLLTSPFMTIGAAAAGQGQVSPPSIQSLLKPEIYTRVIKDRSIQTSASLRDAPPPFKSPTKDYSFYAVMLTRAGLTRTRQVLTDYQLYSKLIPYVDETQYNPSTHLLELKGGIWKWKLSSTLRFEERGDRWIHFQIVGGHFTGMTGDIFFEPQTSSQDTLVYMRGNQQGTRWPPAFILEQGAQIVFEFTAKRMRSYLESQPENEKRSGRSQNDQIPQPRSHL
jgi:hypothetical protein